MWNKIINLKKCLLDHFMDLEISQNEEYQSKLQALSFNPNLDKDGGLRQKDKQRADIMQQIIPLVNTMINVSELVIQSDPILQSSASSVLKITAPPFELKE
ncbi:hypothetical protein RclHR1_19210001 [Rhizophagus clarus]|nr:hypothetical protein RclHR1_19210001 [Rhizophagus clarus]